MPRGASQYGRGCLSRLNVNVFNHARLLRRHVGPAPNISSSAARRQDAGVGCCRARPERVLSITPIPESGTVMRSSAHLALHDLEVKNLPELLRLPRMATERR